METQELFSLHLIDDEYVEQIREYGTFYAQGLNYLKDLIQNLAYVDLDPIFQRNTVEVLERLSEVIGGASNRLRILRHPDNLAEAYRLENRIRQYEGIAHYIIDAIDQRMEGHSTEQLYFYSVTKSEFIGRKIYIAIDNLMNHFLSSYFPPEISRDTISLVLFGHEMGYQVTLVPHMIPLVAITHIPKIDFYRSRFWSCLGHETVHQEYHSMQMPQRYESLRHDMIDDLVSLGSQMWQVALPGFAVSQFEELICDLSSLILSGPPDLLSLLTLAGNPRIEAQFFDRHPPLSVRVKYMTRYLEELESNPDSSYQRMLQNCVASWENVKDSLWIPYREKRYIEEYDRLVEHYYDDLLEFSQAQFVPRIRFFEPADWETSAQAYESYKNGTGLAESNLDFTQILNLVWVKRCEVTKNIYIDEHVPERFTIWHEFERKFFDDIVNLMIEIRG